MLSKSIGNTAGIAGRLGCLEYPGRLSWMPWESSGISEIARVTNVRFLSLTHGLMIRLADRSDGYVYYTYSALQYDLMGIIPRRGFPCDCSYCTLRDGRRCHQRFRVTYLPAVRYYLANLGTTMEAQVRSSVFYPLCLFPQTIDVSSSNTPPLLFPRASLCAAHPLSDSWVLFP